MKSSERIFVYWQIVDEVLYKAYIEPEGFDGGANGSFWDFSRRGILAI